jgi:hypothetical protein
VNGGKPVARVATARRVRLTIEISDVDHAMLVALVRHLNRTTDEVVTEALRDLFVALPRSADRG